MPRDDACPNCQTGTMEPNGPVCVPGDRRKSWKMCDSCQNITDLQHYDCDNDRCDVHGSG